MADPAYIDADGVLTDGEAWVGIAHASLSLPASTVTWTSTDDGQTGDFSQYMDLVIVQYAQGTTALTPVLRFNNDTGSNYTYQELTGTGSAASAGTASTSYIFQSWMPQSSSTNMFGACVTHLFDINSGKYKSALCEYASDWDGGGYVGIVAGTWKSQAPISEIDLSASPNFSAGSMFSLFGVLPRMVA
jgi:hypothetical protein